MCVTTDQTGRSETTLVNNVNKTNNNNNNNNDNNDAKSSTDDVIKERSLRLILSKIHLRKRRHFS